MSRSSPVTPRRQSLRLKAINAVYSIDDASDSKFQQQTSADNNQHGANQKFENSIVGQGHFINYGCSEDCGDKESSMDSDDLIIIDMTLKDMQTKCKARKRKNLKSVASSTSNLESDSYCGALPQTNEAFLKPKEEEPDLEEPLINLKLKLSSKRSTERKRRKCTHSSESFVPIEEKTDQISSNVLRHCSLPIKTDRVSSKKELAAASASDKNVEVISQKDPLHADRSELVYDVKSEIMDNCFCDVQMMDNGAVTSTVGSSANYHVLAAPSANLLQNVRGGESVNAESCCFSSNFQSACAYDCIDMASYNSSSHSSSVMGTNHEVDSPEPVDVVKSEALEVVPLSCENTIYVSHSSTEDFIAKLSYSENSSCELLEKVDGDASLPGRSPYLTRESLLHGDEKVSSELKEADEYTGPPASTEDHLGVIRGIESSEIYCLKVSPSLLRPKTSSCSDCSGLVSVTEDLSPDTCDVIENQTTQQKETEDNSTTNEKSYSATADSPESMSANYATQPRMIDDVSNQVDEAIIKMQFCSLQNNIADEHSLLRGAKSDLKIVSHSRLEGGCLDKLVLEAFAGDSLTKGYKDDNVPQTEDCFSLGTYSEYPPLHALICASTFYDLHGVESSSKNEANSSTLEDMVNGYREKATSSELDDNSSRAEELTAHDHSPQVVPPCPSAMNGLHNTEDSLCRVTGKLPVAEEKLHPTADMPNCPIEKSYSIDEGQSMEKEFECDKGVKEDHPPKKLLSNRKELSPTSQEKLLQALNDNDLYDTRRASDSGEAEVMMSNNRMMKRTRSSTNGSPLQVTKGILRSPDKSGSTCSCMKSTLIHTQAQKSITFSQRQMQDTETITTKLLKELKSMKNILEVCLSPEQCPLGLPELTREEIRIAAESASGLEATTRKWLSMMSKDCTRFCKIMRSTESHRATENKIATSVNSPRKQRKKITFADEAGGLLCHVKLFEQDPASSDEHIIVV